MKMDFLKWFFLLVAALAVRAQEEGEGESQPKSKPSTAPGLTLNLTYDGGTSRLALTRGLPMVLQVYDRQKLAEAKEKAEKQKKKPSSEKQEGQERRKREAAEDDDDDDPSPAAVKKEGSSGNSYSSSLVATIPVLANATSVVGDRKEEEKGVVVHTLQIQFGEVSLNQTKVLDRLEVNIKMIAYLNTSYWDLVELTVNGEGTARSGGAFAVNNAVVVTPKPGYTTSPSDKVCGRGYSTCAPAGLCWTCNVMDLKPNSTADANGTSSSSSSSSSSTGGFLGGLVLPGMQLQPFYQKKKQEEGNEGKNVTSPRFGPAWDCDPVLSSSLWASLLISLFLVVVLGWAISYVASMKAPDRFDTQKTIPMLAKVE